MKAYFHRWRSLVILALLLAPLLWPLQYFAERYYSEQLAEQNRQTLDLYVANLLGTLRRYEELPQILGGLPVLRQALQQPGDPLLQKIANEALADIRRRTGADVIYLLQPDGTTQVASNWAQADSFVHRNFAFRPYYREAMQGRLARFFGLGTTSIKRGYYFASAVKEGSRIIGVLVVKVDLEHIERLWGNSPEQLLVIDNYGVVILSSREDWRFHASRPLSAAERDEIHANIPYPVQDPKPLRLQQSAWLSQSRTLPETGWTVSIYAPRTLIERPVRSVLLIGGATLLALLLLLTLLTLSRRHYLDRIALEAEAKRQLEERVLERTRELENANAQLQQEVHEREQAQRELMRAQDEVVQAGKLTALGTMSASISHELNQPLAAIRSYADNARVLLDHQRTEDARGNLEQISDLTTRMASIIAHLKAYARGARRAPEERAVAAGDRGRPVDGGQPAAGDERRTAARRAGRPAVGPGRRDPLAADPRQPAHQCPRRARRESSAAAPVGNRQPGPARRDPDSARQRPGVFRGRPGPRPRTLFHHQDHRQRARPRPGHLR